MEEIEKAIIVENPIDLAYLLSKIALYIPLFVYVLQFYWFWIDNICCVFFSGDIETIERIAYELCEDQAKQHVLYFETRFSPHFLCNTWNHFYNEKPVPLDSPKAVTPDDAVRAVGRGLKRGEQDFDIQARMILCTIKGQAGWSYDVVRMASEFASDGVVAIDIAGDESVYSDEEKEAFERALQLNIHRTVHAGEMGPATNVAYAVKKLHAERIGHGYHVIQDQAIYNMCRSKDVHFETCPYSSYFTAAVRTDEKHAIVTFAEDNVNFSINKDDPTQTKSTLDKEYQLLRRHGLNELHFVRAVRKVLPIV